MKKILIILLFFIGQKVVAQQPSAPIPFTDTTQMINYPGSYTLGVVTDTATGGLFSNQLSSAIVDNIRVFRAANTSYRWMKLSTFYEFIKGFNGQIPYFTTDNSSSLVANDLLNVAKFVYNDAQLDSMKTTKAAQIEIFNRWKRFAHGGVGGAGNEGTQGMNDTIPNRPDATNSFAYDADNNLVNSTYNTGAYIGFINNLFSTHYQLFSTVSASNNVDNDRVGLVIAYVEDRNDLVRNNAFGLDPNDFTWPINTTDSLIPNQHTLSVYRNRENTAIEYYVLYDAGKTDNQLIANGTSLLSYKPTSNWKSDTTEADLKILRTGDTIQIFTTEYADNGSGKGALGHEISFRLTDNAVLNKFRNGSFFGISCQSQQDAYWQNLSFSDNTLNIYDLRNGDVWIPDSTGTYVLTDQSTFIDVGIRRLWYNPFIGTYGYINPDSSYYVIDSVLSNNVVASDTSIYYNVKLFGVTGDGTTDDYAAANTANNYVAAQGGGVLWWPAGTYRTTKPIYRVNGVHWYGVQDESIIENTNPTLTTFNSQGCQFMGNYSPSDYDTTVARYFVGHMGTYSNKMAIVDSISKFTVGDIVFIASLGGWPTNDGHFKFYVSRFNEIDSIYNDTVVFKYQLDTLLATARITIGGHFISLPHNDAYGHPRYFVKNSNTRDMSFKSSGEWMLGEAALNCNMENINVRAAELLSTNGLAFCTIKNLYGNWWKQVIEFAIGCHNTTVDGVNAQFINNTYLTEDSNQPFIKFGEQCYKMTLKNIFVNAGNYDGRCVWFGASTNGLIDNLTVIGRNINKTFADFSNTNSDTALSSFVNNNTLRNSTFDNKGSLQYYVYMMKPAISGAMLSNNSVDNCTFTGTVSGSHALLIDGYNTLINNSDFGNGVVAFGDSVSNGNIINTALGNPRAYNANVNINAYNSSATTLGSKGIGFTEGTNCRVGQTTLVGGTKAITIAGLTTSSRAFPGFVTNGGTVTTTWQYKFVCTANTLIITAIDNAGTINTLDTSTLNYFILN